MSLPRAAIVLPLVALLFLFAAPACRADVSEGTRVRVSILERGAAPDSLLFVSGYEPGKRLVGTFVGADSSAITIDDEKGFERTIPNEIVSQFEVSDGRKLRTGRGAVIGLIAGTVAGFAFGTYFEDSENVDGCGECFPGDGAYVMGFTLGGAILGTGVGALVGASIKTERWRETAPRPRP